MKFKIIIITLSIYLLSCGTQRMLKTNVDPKSIDSLLFFTPLSKIIVLDKANNRFCDTSLLDLSKSNIKSGIKEIFSKKITFIENKYDSALQNKINFEINDIVKQVEKSKSIQNILYPKTIDSLMQINKLKYALCLYHRGFTHTYESRNFLNGKTAVIMLLSLGSVFVYNNLANTSISGFIVDREHKNIAFYRTNREDDLEPGDKDVTDRQLIVMFWNYFHYK